MNCSGLQLVRYQSDERLDRIMEIHRENGVYIANPHVYMVEDGKQGQVNPDVVATKLRLDPLGLLNPGKLRGWQVREQIMADAAAGRHVAQAKTLRAHFGDEVHTHLEFIRTKEGAMTCSGLQLVRYRSDQRLDEIMQIHRDHGVYIANPHVWVVEDGKQGQVNPDVVATKLRFDPMGLLNPGKLRGWVERERIMADAAAGRVTLGTLPRF
jgi:FAD/FMN-containing dehydrogenase